MDTNASVEAGLVPLRKRKRLTEDQRQAILRQFHQSELTQEAFAAQQGICTATLGNWLRAERESAGATAPVISFEELRLPPAGSWAVEIVTPQHWTVRLSASADPALVAQWLRALPC